MQADTLESAQKALRESAEALKQAIDDYVHALSFRQEQAVSAKNMPPVDCWHFEEGFWKSTDCA